MKPQDLRERSQRLALDVVKLCDTLPRDRRTQETAEQLHDAANSQAINYRAACGARSHDEFVAKLCVTAEEADETKGWLEMLIDSGKASGPQVQKIYKEATELVKIFAASKRTALLNQAKRRKTEPKRRRKANDQ